jgi:predicted lipoprotein with Yx(FWY)xxD motif
MWAMRSSLVRRGGLGTVVLAAGILLVAACSSNGSKSVSAGASPAATATVLLGSKNGSVLTDASGISLYTFDKDTAGAATSACTGACAAAWPPLTATGTPTAGPGVAGTLGTISGRQVTWDGHPLYRWMGDKAPGDVTGDGINGFHAANVSASGGTAPKTTTPTTAKSGSGY